MADVKVEDAEQDAHTMANTREYASPSCWTTREFRVWGVDEDEAFCSEVEAPCAVDAAEIYAEQLDSECTEAAWDDGGLHVFVHDIERGVVFRIAVHASVSFHASAMKMRPCPSKAEVPRG